MVDKWELPWHDDLNELIDGVMISRFATPTALQWAYAVHAQLLKVLKLEDKPGLVPLVFYDPTDTAGVPFTLIPNMENEKANLTAAWPKTNLNNLQ